MNLPSFRRALAPLCLLVIACFLMALPHIKRPSLAEARYAKCARLASDNPQAALAMAQLWISGAPELSLARHCEALALFATGNYARAGDDFAGLAQEAGNKPALASPLKLQAAKAYLAAKQYDRAQQLAGEASVLFPSAEAKSLAAQITKEKQNFNTIVPAAGKQP